MPLSQLWYLKAQLIVYLLFAIASKLCKDSYCRMAAIVALLIILWIMISLILGRQYINMVWYNTMPLFPIGMLVASKEEYIIKMIRKRPIIITFVLTDVAPLFSAISFLWQKL